MHTDAITPHWPSLTAGMTSTVMPNVFLIAVLAIAVLGAGQARTGGTASAAGPGTFREERVAEAGAAAHTAVDAIVPPVKRVAPRTPVFTHGSAGGTAASGSNKKTEPIAPARPNCDPGYKVDAKGTSCVPSSPVAAQAKPNPEKGSTRKKKR